MQSGSRQTELEPRVLKRLQVSSQPFAAPTECDQLFHNTALDMLANSVIQQLSGSSRIHLIFGEKAIGKTCFCRRLFCEAPPQLRLKFFPADRQSKIGDVLAAIKDPQNPLSQHNTEDLATLAARQVFQELRKQHQPALLIDDAHLLNPAVLRMIFRFISAIEKQGLGSMKLVLIAEKKLEQALQQLAEAAPGDEQLQTSLLRPFSRIEIADYIEFRLTSAGGSNKPLGVKTLNEIYRLSGGLPGRIDRYVCEVLNHGRIVSAGNTARKKILAVLAAVLVVVGATGWWLLRSTPTTGQSASPASAQIQAQQMPEPIPERRNAMTDTTAVAAELNSADLGQAADTDSVDTIETAAADDVAVTAQLAEPADLPTLSVRDEQWLRQFRGESYVIQLLGSRDRERLLDLAQQYTLPKDLIIISSQRGNQPWHALLYGVFIEAGEAEQALQQLPAELRDSQPWIRRIDSILSH